MLLRQIDELEAGLFELERRFLTDELALVPCCVTLCGVI